MILTKRFAILLLLILLSACAKRGTISGGLKDTLAPVLKSSFPKNLSTEFKGNLIKLNFDEYVKIKDANKQVIVSPPMVNAPIIKPTTASKTISIKFVDTLRENTTYSINFGQSISDNNESNAFRNYKYVFSTGKYIDSLTLKGTMKDALTKSVDSYVSVQLYDVNDDFNDSIIYKKPPRYVTSTLDSATTFKFENLKAGKYLLVALKDLNSNYKYDPKREKIAFRKQYVTVPSDSIYDLSLFKEVLDFKASRPIQASSNRAFIPIEGTPENIVAALYNGDKKLRSTITNVAKKDSVQIWFEPTDADSLRLMLRKDSFNKENLILKLRKMKTDTLSVKAVTAGVLAFRDDFIVESSIPLNTINSDKISLRQKDSLAVDFSTKYDSLSQQIHFIFKKEPVQAYTLTFLPGALEDFYGNKNDTLRFRLKTGNLAEFGNLKIVLDNVKTYPIIVELTNAKGDLVAMEYSESSNTVDFLNIPPNLYTIRIIYDANGNKIWDAGNFLAKRQSEDVFYFDKAVDVRENWDVEQAIDLGG